jgi:hypothetical protein
MNSSAVRLSALLKRRLSIRCAVLKVFWIMVVPSFVLSCCVPSFVPAHANVDLHDCQLTFGERLALLSLPLAFCGIFTLGREGGATGATRSAVASGGVAAGNSELAIGKPGQLNGPSARLARMQ